MRSTTPDDIEILKDKTNQLDTLNLKSFHLSPSLAPIYREMLASRTGQSAKKVIKAIARASSNSVFGKLVDAGDIVIPSVRTLLRHMKKLKLLEQGLKPGAPDSTLGDFRQYLIDKLGHDQWLSEQQISTAFSDYREKIMECAPRMKKAVKHCTLYAEPGRVNFDAIILNLQSLGDPWQLSLFIRDDDGKTTQLLSNLDFDIEWDQFCMCRLDLAAALHKELKVLNFEQGHELCLQIHSSVFPIGCALVSGTNKHGVPDA